MRIEDIPKGCLRTNSGLFINIFEPKPEMICVEDIAHGCGRQPRFGNQLDRHYSVAQHCMKAAEMASPRNKRAAFFHDASEAFMLDMPTPIKAILPDYKMYENRLMAVIAEKFEFEFPFDPEIKIIDKELLHIEWDNLVDKNNMEFKCLTALQAKKEFLRMYYELIK